MALMYALLAHRCGHLFTLPRIAGQTLDQLRGDILGRVVNVPAIPSRQQWADISREQRHLEFSSKIALEQRADDIALLLRHVMEERLDGTVGVDGRLLQRNGEVEEIA